jgi:photosystem II stability/assembly factor-like uncharacterized protein
MAAAQVPTQPQAPQQVWQMQDSGTKVSLRGIDSVDGQVAWASGNGGTILKTIDGGAHWQKCTFPDAGTDGVTLDFRGVQAFDAWTAIVMASGPDQKSRLYRTADGCVTWDLVLTNHDPEGFFDAIHMTSRKTGILISDPVKGTFYIRGLSIKQHVHGFPLYATVDGGETWRKIDDGLLEAREDKDGNSAESIFAASNSSMLDLGSGNQMAFITGGAGSSLHFVQYTNVANTLQCKGPCSTVVTTDSTFAGGKTAGGFSLAANLDHSGAPIIVAVGGDFNRPDASEGTSATCLIKSKGKNECKASATPPHGYRSAVAYDATLQAFVAAGPNGSDISRDDGKTWAPLDNGAWNALSLPFIVGPGGRIGKLNPAALAPEKR